MQPPKLAPHRRRLVPSPMQPRVDVGDLRRLLLRCGAERTRMPSRAEPVAHRIHGPDIRRRLARWRFVDLQKEVVANSVARTALVPRCSHIRRSDHPSAAANRTSSANGLSDQPLKMCVSSGDFAKRTAPPHPSILPRKSPARADAPSSSKALSYVGRDRFGGRKKLGYSRTKKMSGSLVSRLFARSTYPV
jgi:hypothetical protein